MPASGNKAAVLRRLAPLLVLVVFVGVLWLIHREMRHFDLREVRRALGKIPPGRIAWALGLTTVSYLVLTCYDVLGLRFLGRRLSYRRTALASFTGYVFNLNLGLSVIGGSAVRYRLYSHWGLTAVDVGKVVAFCTLTSGIGLLTVGGAVFTLGDIPAGAEAWLPVAWVRPIGVLLLAIVATYLYTCFRRSKPLQLRSWQLELPRGRIAVAQVLLAATDLFVAGSVLYVLGPATDVSFPFFLGVYLFALTAGLISHVPGGVGVFESVILVGLPTHEPQAQILAALLAFRAVYYLIPFGCGVLLLGAHEAVRHAPHLARAATGVSRSVSAVAPNALAFATFAGGVILLASGATPSVASRLHWMRGALPLPVVEISHFLGSVAGAALLFLARGLQRRLNGAWVLTVSLLAAGVILSVAKGLDWEEAGILTLMLAALVSSRNEFYRKSSFLDQRFTLGWMVAIALVLAGTVWLGMFAYKHVDYSSDLWWRFSFRADAPRFLRATAGVAVLVVVIGVARLLRSPVVRPAAPTPEALREASALVAASTSSNAWLAMLGDKSLLFSEDRAALLMYGVAGRCWVAMGDPIGPEEQRVELAWRFRELCDEQGAWPVFYEVSASNLPLYVDLGLSLFKLGEEARVPLDNFSLAGGARKNLRTTKARLEREGCSFVVWSPAEVAGRMPELRAISDGWLARKSAREKGFSLGVFDERYLANFPVGVVLREERPVAFANLWPGGRHEELSVDLMRFSEEAPPSTMEYLFIQLLLHGAAEKYRWFNLGMAPLSGIENHPLAPLWNRIGAVLFAHGEHFYNFRGLRQYKEKFDPVWQPKYLVCPGGFILPRVLTGVASLISGGLVGVVKR